LSTAHLRTGEAETFRVVHPFHPLYRKSYRLVTYKHTWGDERVYYLDEEENLRSIPARWTDVVGADSFIMVAAGRSAFRLEDLLALRRLVDEFLPQSSLAGQQGGTSDV
jgi:hypothetical protein